MVFMVLTKPSPGRMLCLDVGGLWFQETNHSEAGRKTTTLAYQALALIEDHLGCANDPTYCRNDDPICRCAIDNTEPIRGTQDFCRFANGTMNDIYTVITQPCYQWVKCAAPVD